MINYIFLILKDLWLNFNFRLIITISLIIVTGFTEGLSVLFLIPLFQKLGIDSETEIEQVSILFQYIGSFIELDWLALISIIIFLCVLQLLLIVSSGWMLSKITQSYLALWKKKLFFALLNSNLNFVSQFKGGELSSIIINDTNRLHSASMNLLTFLSTILTSIIYLVYCFLLSPSLSFLILSSGLFLSFMLGFLYKKTKNIGLLLGPLLSNQQVIISESISGFETIKINVLEGYISKKFSRIIRDIEVLNRIGAFIPFLVRGIFENFGIIFLVFIMIISINYLNLSIALVLILIALFVRIFPRLSSIQQNIHTLNTNAPSIERLSNLYTRATQNIEIYNLSHVPINFNSNKIEIKISNLDVSFEKKKILKKVNLKLSLPGLVCIVGPSGSGKSTLLSTLVNLKNYEGKVFFNGIDLTELPLKSLRKIIGYVPQDIFLFNDTIEKNIYLDNLNASSKFEEVTKFSVIDKFINSLPNTKKTIVGDKGVFLSGGERQRIGIARSLISSPKLLLLDEPTNSLDEKNEDKVFKNILNFKRNRGIIMVTHNMNFLKKADQVVIIMDGNIFDYGSWKDIKNRNKNIEKILLVK